jgi:hypothetical protein
VIPDLQCDSPSFEDCSDVRFIERKREVETLSTCTANQSLTKRVRLREIGTLSAALLNLATGPEIEFAGIDAVSIMNKELVRFLSCEACAKLLQRPFCGWMTVTLK